MTDDRYDRMLKAAVQLGMYYAYLAQLLRKVINPEGPADLPEDLLRSHLERMRDDLKQLLATHPVVKEHVEEVGRKVGRIREAASKQATWGEAVKEARRYLPEIEIRAKTVGDLVALTRGFERFPTGDTTDRST